MKFALVAMLCLLFIFPLPAFEGAKSGLLLWFHTVLPSLLPFIIISNILIRLNITKQISGILYPVLKHLFPISKQGSYPILIGFLSGMPMGAKATSDLLFENKIGIKEATFLLTMCNNVSPMFIMSYIALNQLNLPKYKYIILLVVYLSSIISALLFYYISKLTQKSKNEKNRLSLEDTIIQPNEQKLKLNIELVDHCIMDGFEVITKIGGYIILFSIIVSIFIHITGKPSLFTLSIIGFVEITNGVSQIATTNQSEYIKIVLITMITAFGGLSGLAQTKSVIKDSRLSLKPYVKVKLISIIISILLIINIL